MYARHNTSMPGLYSALAIFFLLFSALPAFAGNALRLDSERLLNFKSTITVRDNGSLLVKERIEVNVLGIGIQNGITREFVGKGQEAPKFTVQQVMMDEQPAVFHVETVGSTKHVIIGDPDQPLLTGVHIYTITYETEPEVAEANGRDHLSWDVTGWTWNLPIDSVTATIQLPKGVPLEELNVAASTGGDGSRSKRYTFDFDTPGAVTFTAEALKRDQGLSVDIDWPLGHIHHHSWGIPLVMMENSGIFVTLTGLAVLLLYWGVLWLYYGRAPKLARLAARTTPPNGVSAAGMRYLRTRMSDGKMFTLILATLARCGVITIEETDGNYTVHRTNADFHSLAPEEREFARILFGTHQSVSMKARPAAVKSAIRALKKTLVKSYEQAFTPVRAFAWPAVIVSALSLLAGMFMQLRTSLKEEFVPAFLLLLVFAVCAALLRHIWPTSLKEWKTDPREAPIPGATGSSPQMFTAALLGIMLIGVTIFLAVKVSFLWVLILVAQTIFNIWFMKIMRVPTPRGQRMLDDLEGFRFHLRKLAAESAFAAEYQDERTQIFEEYIDYALSYDLETEWIRRVDRASDEPPYCPAWFFGEHFREFYLHKSLAPSSAGIIPGLEGLDKIAGGRFVH